jgi:tol-pal system protein YbgF
MGARIFAFATVAALAAGCGETVSRAELADLRQRLESEQRRNAAAERKLDELENRVFLLSDQLQHQKLASLNRTTRVLPIAAAKPSADEPVASDDSVAFEGEARSNDPDHARPVAARAEASRAHAAPAVERTAAGDPLALYRAAYDELRAGNHDAAARGFREIVRRFPHHEYADDAQYWLGECLYAQKRYAQAAPEFRAVVQRWPSGNKAPDALVKVGLSLLAAGDVDKGRAALREVPAAYPRSAAARLASERLSQLAPREGSK